MTSGCAAAAATVIVKLKGGALLFVVNSASTRNLTGTTAAVFSVQLSFLPRIFL